MTKFCLEQDQKKFHQGTLTLEHDRKITMTNMTEFMLSQRYNKVYSGKKNW